MAKAPVNRNVQQISFTNANGKTVDLDFQVASWSDTRVPRVAEHRYLKRDGAEGEYMGRDAHRVKFSLVYMGEFWRRDFVNLLGTIDDNPYGTLVHPFLGRMQVFCRGVEDAQVSIEGGVETVLVPISFSESNVDQRIQITSAQEGPGAKSQKITTYNANLNTATAIYVAAASVAAISAFSVTALAYSSASIASTLAGAIPDPTLPQQLTAVNTNALAARNAIRVDPAFTSDAIDFPVILAVELLLAACFDLDDAIKASKPVLIQYIVPALTPLSQIAQSFYGKDGLSRIDEIRINNPGKLPNPAAVQGGTVLLLATPTVRAA